MTDSQILVERAASGDDSAVQQLLVRHLPSLEAYVRLEAGALVRGKESCSDLVQSVCAEVLEDLPGFEYRGERQFRHWLFKQALHKIMNKHRFYRAQKRDVARERPPAGATDSEAGPASVLACYGTICTPSRVAMGQEALAAFEAAFDALPDDYKKVVSLHRVVGLRFVEIGAEIGRSENATRNLFNRAIARLTTLLAKSESQG